MARQCLLQLPRQAAFASVHHEKFLFTLRIPGAVGAPVLYFACYARHFRGSARLRNRDGNTILFEVTSGGGPAAPILVLIAAIGRDYYVSGPACNIAGGTAADCGTPAIRAPWIWCAAGTWRSACPDAEGGRRTSRLSGAATTNQCISVKKLTNPCCAARYEVGDKYAVQTFPEPAARYSDLH